MSFVNIGEDRIYSYEKVKGKVGCRIRHKIQAIPPGSSERPNRSLTPRPDGTPSLSPQLDSLKPVHPKNPRELSAVLQHRILPVTQTAACNPHGPLSSSRHTQQPRWSRRTKTTRNKL